jgi:hypothetical protein
MEPTEYVELTPNWAQLFNYAIAKVKSEIDHDNGRDFVVEMLEYGKRLYLYVDSQREVDDGR